MQNQSVREIVETALELAPADRAAFLETACAGDDALRQIVERKLADFEAAGDFLEAPAVIEPEWLTDLAPDLSNEAERHIGAYRLLEKIASGGMGTVYLAERADRAFDKRVAIKLIWAGADGTEIARRAQVERKILAKLDHPNIARLLDGGDTRNGQPYFVMEYVDGLPITECCRRRALPLKERLRLFQTVCDAVQYAHQNLIVHRDLKPANILVTWEGTVKLLDFGIAKILDAESGGETPTILNFVTPAYASPEHLRGERITTASDVYSLGVLLYELLTGRRPFDTQSAPEALRRIETEEPLRPSLAPLSPPESGLHHETPTTDAPEFDRRPLRGDLDNIVMKALQREPSRRYQSAREFSDDITRHLSGAPVIARDATWTYRTGKFIRRRKAQIAVAMIAIAVLLGVMAREALLRRQAQEQNRRQRRDLYSAQIQQALQDWRDGNLRRVRETLANWMPQPGAPAAEDLRGFEWRYFWTLLHSESLTIDLPGGIHAMALSPDGKIIATGQQDGTALLTDSQTGERIATLGKHAEIIRGIAFSPDGKWLATCDAIGVTWLWDVAGRREILQVGGHGTRIVHAVVFSPDSKTFATAGGDGLAKLWSAETGTELLTFNGHADGVRYLLFSPDGRSLYTGNNDSTIRCWDATTGKERKVLRGFPVDVLNLAVTPDGKYLISSGSDPTIKMWDLATGTIVRVFAGHAGHVWRIVISPDGKLLASGSTDRTAKLWDIASGRELAKVKGQDQEVSFLAFTPDGRRLFTGDYLRLMAWQVARLLQSRILRVPSQCQIAALSLSSDGNLLATGEFAFGGSCKPPANIGLWDIHSAKMKWISPSKPGITALGFLPFDNRLAYSTIDRQAYILDPDNGQPVAQFTHHYAREVLRDSGSTGSIRSLAVSPDGRAIATGGDSNTVKLWTPDGRELRMLIGPGNATEADEHAVHALAFSHDCRKLAVGGFDADVPIFDPMSGRELLRLAGHQSTILAIQFSPDDRTIATAGEDSLIKLWDAADGRLLQTLPGHADQVTCLAWTPDGKRLASAGKDRTIRFWNVETGLEVFALKEHTDAITALAFSADGRLLVSGGWDATVRLWRAATEEEVSARLASVANQNALRLRAMQSPK